LIAGLAPEGFAATEPGGLCRVLPEIEQESHHSKTNQDADLCLFVHPPAFPFWINQKLTPSPSTIFVSANKKRPLLAACFNALSKGLAKSRRKVSRCRARVGIPTVLAMRDPADISPFATPLYSCR
jgi:hypothetical protein